MILWVVGSNEAAVWFRATCHDHQTHRHCVKKKTAESPRFIILTVPGLVQKMDQYHWILMWGNPASPVHPPEASAHSNTARMSHSMVFGSPTMKHPPIAQGHHFRTLRIKKTGCAGAGNWACLNRKTICKFGSFPRNYLSDQPNVLPE